VIFADYCIILLSRILINITVENIIALDLKPQDDEDEG